MTTSASRLFGVGISGPVLLAEERAILERYPPRAVILFRRNIEDKRQLEDLTAEIQSLPGAPFLALDQEGGPVDRLKGIVGPFPSFHTAARTGFARRAGELAGEACARLGFDVDLAPVVDRRLPGAGETVLGERTAAEGPDDVTHAAREFLRGLHSRGIGGCLKHFPGLGRARSDTHKSLPLLPNDPGERERDLAPFRALQEIAGAIMVSHAAGSDGVPATLSRDVATTLLREGLGFEGVAMSDDLEMGALDAFGALPDRSAAALRAGCDLLWVCSRIGEYPECVARVERDVPEDRRDEASSRIEAYAEGLADLKRRAVPPSRPLEVLAAHVAALRETIAEETAT
ncbi:MAG TPA: glycoside hydrolase family 3 N-terminal domain-containing protein [Thermoanaerobaculia bacterium]|nr:glycoside hydrolase family 3 N-terminal domain-containing protein [Thermoanaerobaculia bacterium]